MTEAEWLGGRKSQKRVVRMLAMLRDRGSERKFRLVLCELMRRIPSANSANSQEVNALAERWADRLATNEEVAEFNKRSFDDYPATQWTVLVAPAATSLDTCIGSGEEYWSRIPVILREVFENPFRRATLDPAWLTSDVRALAEGIYQDRAFDRMPILADALQDAGCDNDDILTHCRATQLPHVRGCWVVDLLTGRK